MDGCGTSFQRDSRRPEPTEHSFIYARKGAEFSAPVALPYLRPKFCEPRKQSSTSLVSWCTLRLVSLMRSGYLSLPS